MKACRLFFICVSVFFLTIQSAEAAEKILLTEGFDDIATLEPSGWTMKNHSEPIGGTSWLQGLSGSPFPPYESTGYIAANFNNASGLGTISNWLITPPLEFSRSSTLTFWSRSTVFVGWADRLEVRLSTNGASDNVGTTSTDVGDFTTLLLSINPNLVGGEYPSTWTQYTIENISGLTGRIAFRYFVTNSGPLGANGDYIGIDSVAVTTTSNPFLMYLPATTGEPKICKNDPQTAMWKGLEWQRCDDGSELQWNAANKFCQNLYLDGHSDWRLPTKDELKNLVVCTNGHPVPMADFHWCSDDGYSSNFASPTINPAFQCLAKGYWTSTKPDSGHAWFVNFVGGNAEIHSLENGNYARCVRTP